MDNYILIIILSLIFSAFFSGIEIAFYQANQLRVELDKNLGNFPAKLISYFVNHPSRFITNTLIGNNIALVIYGNQFTEMTAHYHNFGISNPFLSFILITLVSSLIVLALAEFFPKALLVINPNRTLTILILPFWLVYYLLYPINVLITWFSKFILWILKAEVKDTKPNFDYYDLFNYVTNVNSKNSKKSNDTIELDTQIFRNAIDLQNIKVREFMIPRTEIAYIDSTGNIEQLRQLFISTGHSKIIVCKENNIDLVTGYVHMIDLYSKPKTIESILRPTIIIAESMPANKLLTEFTASNRSLGLVVNEFGGTAGIVAIEDVLEEIFGEIDDEHDLEQLKEVQVNDTEFIFSARLEIDYLNEKYPLDLPEGEYETLGGLILGIHENIPSKNQIIDFRHFRFKILSASENRINEIHLKVREIKDQKNA